MEEFTYNVDNDDKNGVYRTLPYVILLFPNEPSTSLGLPATQFKDLLKRIRASLTNSTQTAANIPTLQKQDLSRPNGFNIIMLRNNGDRITLRIRRDNVYLEGYQQGTGDWYEFKPDGKPLQMITRSKGLGYGGAYDELERMVRGNAGDASKGHRRNFPLGRYPLAKAVTGLFNPPKDKGKIIEQERARNLLIIIQMICEALRRYDYTTALLRNWENGAKPTEEMLKMQTSWGTRSQAIRNVGANAGPDTPVGDGWTVGSVFRAIALVLFVAALYGGTKLGPQMDEPAGDDSDRRKGRTLVEIFWLRIDSANTQLYGTVTAYDATGIQTIFKRDQNRAEKVDPGKYATITGPRRCIGAADPFELRFDLFGPHSVSQGSIAWNTYDSGKLYDQAITTQVPGAQGAATLQYVVMGFAAQAKIDVVLVNGDDENPANIYGEITANNGHGTIDLFRRFPRARYVNIYPGDDVPLLRSIVAAPMDGSLKIHADLIDHDSDSKDDEVANGTAKFTPKIGSREAKTIKGKHGEIRVTVQWS
ncbi:ribosome-inactivating protein [Nemania sp. FL0916]|nr:ribosome-inactivating protein [Nemania sp. FL0916]